MESEDDQFDWRDLRGGAFGIRIWPLNWWPLWQVHRRGDWAGGEINLICGPIEIMISYNMGEKRAAARAAKRAIEE